MFLIHQALKRESLVAAENPGRKLLMIKLAVFLSFVQGFVVALVLVGDLDVNDDDNPAEEAEGMSVHAAQPITAYHSLSHIQPFPRLRGRHT